MKRFASIFLTLFALAFLVPRGAEAQFGPTFAASDDDGLSVGVLAFAGSRPECDSECAAFTAGLYIERANGQSLGIDADWLDMSDVTVTYGFPTGTLDTFLTASVGRHSEVTEGPNDYATNTSSNRLVVTALGVGLGWRYARLRVSHDGANALWQAGLAWSPGFIG